MKFLALLLFATASFAYASGHSHAPYPEEWWTPVPKDTAPGWEVLPQEAGPGEVILSKRNELGLLSNFAATPFELNGEHYASVEGFWQMMKYPEGPNDERLRDPSIKWSHTRAEVARMTAFEAKKAGSEANGNMKKLGIDWVTYRGKKMNYLEPGKGDFYQVIYAAEMAKLQYNAKVRSVLLKTGDLKLRPDHIQSASSPPAWKYYDIWMELRAGLK